MAWALGMCGKQLMHAGTTQFTLHHQHRCRQMGTIRLRLRQRRILGFICYRAAVPSFSHLAHKARSSTSGRVHQTFKGLLPSAWSFFRRDRAEAGQEELAVYGALQARVVVREMSQSGFHLT